MRYLLTLLIVLAACFTAQWLALRAVGGRTVKSESNFFSSIGRIQTGAEGPPEIMLLGSSLTGRLPDRVNGFPGVANLGCDGGSAVDTLRAIDSGILPMASTLIIEGNTLSLAVDAKETEISRAMRSPWFALGLRVPNLGATARPAAFLYSTLMARKMGSMGSGAREDLGISSRPHSPGANGIKPSAEEEALLNELQEILLRLRSRGTTILIAIYPQGNNPPSRRKALARELAARTKVPFWDLTEGLGKDRVRYTDGVHLDPPSATAVMTTLIGPWD